MNPNEGYEDFDWSTLSKKELDKLYHSIIDHAMKDNWYKIFVMHKWNISAMEFHNRAVKSLAVRIRSKNNKIKKDKIIAEGILKYCERLPGNPDDNYRYLRNQVLHVYSNSN